MTNYRNALTIAAMAVWLAVPLAAQKPDPTQAALKAAIDKEMVDGDLKGAIALYEKTVARAGRDRATAAKALVRMAECHHKLGDAEARQIYERVLRDYSDQNEAVAAARTRLADGFEPKPGGVLTRQIWAGRGVDGAGTPSPDGRYLTFTNWATGDLGLRDLANGTNRLLTNTGGWAASGDYVEGRSIISPDGRSVAYAWYLDKDNLNELRVLSTAGNGAPRVVFRSQTRRDWVQPCGWSPDGKQLLVIRQTPDRSSQIAMLSLENGTFRTIKSIGWGRLNATLSPDGQFIAFEAPASDDASQRDVFVLAVDGSHESRVAQSPAEDRYPIWSPDGSQLLFLSTRTGSIALWSVPVQAGKPAGPEKLLKADVGPVQPLGITQKGSLYYSLPGSQVKNVYIAELDGQMKASKAPALATGQFVNSSEGPSWSPDGQSLAYYASARASFSLVIRSLKTGEERAIPLKMPAGTLFSAGPVWFPDGQSILVYQRQFYRVHLDSGKVELVHTPRAQPNISSYRLSSDGKAIYYCHQSDGTGVDGVASGSLHRFDIGSEAPVVLKERQWFIAIALSRDSSQLAYLVSHRPGSASSLWVMPAAGGDAREVFRGANWMDGSRYGTLEWTPDSHFLLFVNADVDPSAPSALWRVPVAGGAAEKMGISMPARIKAPTIHPDGRRIAFGTMDGDSGEIWTMENFLPMIARK